MGEIIIKTIKEIVNLLLKKIKLSKINYLNKKFKKYIIKYSIENNQIKITNSNGNFKYVENNIPNKVKVMEIIKDHEKEMIKRIDNYSLKSDD